MEATEAYLFDLQGFLLVQDALPADLVQTLNSLIDEHLSAEPVGDKPNTRFSPLPWGEAFLTAMENPRLEPRLAALLGEDYRLDHAYVDVIFRPGLGPIGATLHGGGTPYDPSQYYHFRNGRLFNGLTVVAYNLRDVNPGDGGFGCVPGSHKANLPLPAEFRDMAQGLASCVSAVPGPAGSAVIFTEALTHGTLPWQGAGERRTLFLKFSPKHMAWSRHYNTGEAFELTEEQRRRFRTPGIYPK